MGEVYRARDTRLNRDVAIKVLPEAVASDGDRLARFTREAQTLAALNHPHIAQVHGLEESGATRALVMELVEGEDLSVHIARGPLPVAEALAIAGQIADALAAAHDLGIVHRDLKPANVKVRSDGTVKVLDFGLAKALDPASASHPPHDPAFSPTMTSPAMTAMGMVMGTATYMSPEQARGKVVDRRADIWAFGCVLYEMLVGPAGVPGRQRHRHARQGHRARARLDRPAGDHAPARAGRHRTLPAQGPVPSAARHRRRPHAVGGGPGGDRRHSPVACPGGEVAHASWRSRRPSSPAWSSDGWPDHNRRPRPTPPRPCSWTCCSRRLRVVRPLEREAGHHARRIEGRLCRRGRRIASSLRALARRVGLGGAPRHRRRLLAGVCARRAVARLPVTRPHAEAAVAARRPRLGSRKRLGHECAALGP